jgi:hypothetical protein
MSSPKKPLLPASQTLTASLRAITDDDANRRVVRASPTRLRSLRPSSTYNEYQVVMLNERYALYNVRLNRMLSARSVHVELDPTPFAPDQRAQALRPLTNQLFAKNAHLFDSKKVRLKSDLTLESLQLNKPVRVQPTNYELSLCTNEMASQEIWSLRTGQRAFDGVSLMAHDGVLYDFSDSPCSNHIGVSTLAITLDACVVVPLQPEQSAYNGNLLVPSGSGSADWADFTQTGKTLQQLLTLAAERELIEECGLQGVSDLQMATRIIGFARLVNRGGKPEFFGVSFLSVLSSALQSSKVELVPLGDLVAALPKATQTLARFRTGQQQRASLQLYLNIQFLEDHINTAPEAFLALRNQLFA